MNRNNKIIGTVVLGLAVVILLFLVLRPNPKAVAPAPETTQVPQTTAVPPSQPQKPETAKNCATTTESVVVPDGHMRGMFNQGDKIQVVKNWYRCHPIQDGDVVYYRFSTQFPPVVRIVRAVGGDRFHLIKDEAKKKWNIKINDSLLSYQGKPYFFGVDPPPVLSLYETEYKGVLPKDDVILFSNVPPGDRDSSTFGVANVGDILGKVVAHGYGS